MVRNYPFKAEQEWSDCKNLDIDIQKLTVVLTTGVYPWVSYLMMGFEIDLNRHCGNSEKDKSVSHTIKTFAISTNS